MRADIFVAGERGISRAKSAELIKAGKVRVGGVLLAKPSQEIDISNLNYEESAEFSPRHVAKLKVEIDSEIYVGRGAIKLKGFLDQIKFEIPLKTALDVGASTGGFTQALLLSGAASVVALDVGVGQLDASLRADERVEAREGCDVRDYARDYVGEGFDVVVADVSFIPLALVLPAINKLAKNDIIMLFKPQFEVGRAAKRTKKGVVVESKEIERARIKFESECAALGWRLRASENCVITGKEGNLERFYHYTKI